MVQIERDISTLSLGCLADPHCPLERPRCLTDSGECVECTSDDDCGVADAGKTVCDDHAHSCILKAPCDEGSSELPPQKECGICPINAPDCIDGSCDAARKCGDDGQCLPGERCNIEKNAEGVCHRKCEVDTECTDEVGRLGVIWCGH